MERSKLRSAAKARRSMALLAVGGLLGAGCSESPTEPDVRRPTPPEAPGPLSSMSTQVCGFDVYPDDFSRYTMNVGQTRRYYARYLNCFDGQWYNVNADWTTTNAAVATITEGGFYGQYYVEAKGVGGGDADIIGTLPGASNSDRGLLTIIAPPPPSPDVTIKGPDTVRPHVNCNYEAYEGTRLTPPYQYQWRWDDGPIVGTSKWLWSAAPTTGGVRLQLRITDANGAVVDYTRYIYSSEHNMDCYNSGGNQ